MSPEVVLPAAAGRSPTAPAAASAAPASAALGTGSSGGNSAAASALGGAGTREAGPSTGAKPAQSSGNAAQQSPSGASAPCGSEADAAKSGKSAAKGSRLRAAPPGVPTAVAAAAVGSQNFSATLAQSLAAPSRALGARPGKPVKTAAAPSADKAAKSDPVSTAMAMVRQAVPITPVLPGINLGATAKASSSPPPAQGALAGTVSASAHDAQRSAAQAGVVAMTSGDAAHALQGSPAAAVSAAASSASAVAGAAALTAGQLAAGTTAAVHTPVAVGAALSTPVGSDGWGAQLGAQLTWMARQGVQSASLQVTPQHLGPVQVSISVRHGQASVWFGAAQPETRQALTQALPELRTMFAQQGLTLTDSGVSHEAPRESPRPVRPAVNAVGEVGAVDEGETVGVLAGTGLLDTYA